MQGGHQPFIHSRHRAAVSAVMVCVLALISGLLYSPWHRHNPASRQACIFAPLEGAAMLEPARVPEIELLPGLAWAPAPLEEAVRLTLVIRHKSARAPPV